MAIYVEGRGLAAEAEPIGLITEGIAGIAVIVLAIIGLSGTISAVMASIVTIVVGVGLVVQAFNSVAEQSKARVPGTVSAMTGNELGGEVMVDLGCGIAGIVLGILALVGVNAVHLVPAALIVFGGALLLSGVISARPRTFAEPGAGGQVVSYQGSAATSGIEVLIGFAAIILGILSLIFMTSWVLTLVGFIAVGAALLIVSATVSSAVIRLFTRTA